MNHVISWADLSQNGLSAPPPSLTARSAFRPKSHALNPQPPHPRRHETPPPLSLPSVVSLASAALRRTPIIARLALPSARSAFWPKARSQLAAGGPAFRQRFEAACGGDSGDGAAHRQSVAGAAAAYGRERRRPAFRRRFEAARGGDSGDGTAHRRSADGGEEELGNGTLDINETSHENQDESLLILSDAFQMQYLLEICLLMQYCSISTAGFAVIAMIVGILISAVIQHSEARSGGVSCRGAGRGCPSHAAGVAALRPAASTRATRHGHPSRTVENIFVLSFQLLLQSH
ncbi:hypothetical protein ABZP36_008522 [Zizania latifolia]